MLIPDDVGIHGKEIVLFFIPNNLMDIPKLGFADISNSINWVRLNVFLCYLMMKFGNGSLLIWMLVLIFTCSVLHSWMKDVLTMSSIDFEVLISNIIWSSGFWYPYRNIFSLVDELDIKPFTNWTSSAHYSGEGLEVSVVVTPSNIP